MKYTLTCLAIIYSFICYAQPQPQTWYFGNGAGLFFDATGAVSASILNPSIATSEGCAVANDKDGNVIFYTDGTTIWYPNGAVAKDPSDNAYILGGNPSSTQSAVIIPKPNSCDTYFVFTTDAEGGKKGMQASMVTIDRTTGNITIPTTSYNFQLQSNTSEKLTFTKNGNVYWIVGHDAKKTSGAGTFYAYKIDKNASSCASIATPVLSTVGLPNYYGLGQMKISKSGKYIALITTHANGYFVECFNFDNTTGQVLSSKGANTTYNGNCGGLSYGLEFSPNERYIYISTATAYACGNYIYRFDLNNGMALPPSLIFNDYGTGLCGYQYGLCGMQLAPNGVIYIANENCDHLAAITDPDNPSIANVGFVENAPGTTLAYGKKCRITLPAVVNAPDNAQPSVPPNGLIAYWPFNNGSLNDESGNGHALIINTDNGPGTSLPYPTNDRYGSQNCAYYVPGNATRLSTNNAPGFNFQPTGQFSITLWYKPGYYTLQFGGLVESNCGTNVYPVKTTNFSVGLSDNGGVYRQPYCGGLPYHNTSASCLYENSVTYATPDSGQWVFLAVTHNNGLWKIYRDLNAPNVSSSVSPVTPHSSCIPLIGDIYIGENFRGDMDDICIYNRELSQSEIAQIQGLKSSCELAASCKPTIPTGRIQYYSQLGQISASPNPSNSLVTLQSSTAAPGGTLVVYNSMGVAVQTQTNISFPHSINISGYPNGMYVFVYFMNGDHTYCNVIKN